MFHKLLQGAQRNILEYSMLIYNVLQHGRIWKVLECSIRSLIILGKSRNWRKKWKNEWYPDKIHMIHLGKLFSPCEHCIKGSLQISDGGISWSIWIHGSFPYFGKSLSHVGYWAIHAGFIRPNGDIVFLAESPRTWGVWIQVYEFGWRGWAWCWPILCIGDERAGGKNNRLAGHSWQNDHFAFTLGLWFMDLWCSQRFTCTHGANVFLGQPCVPMNACRLRRFSKIEDGSALGAGGRRHV